MEAINDVSKAVAQSLDLIKKYLYENDIDNEPYLEDVQSLLENALEKLINKM